MLLDGAFMLCKSIFEKLGFHKILFISIFQLSACSSVMEIPHPDNDISGCSVSVNDTRINEGVLDARIDSYSIIGTPDIIRLKTEPNTSVVLKSYLCSDIDVGEKKLTVNINEFFCDAYFGFSEAVAKFEIGVSYEFDERGLQQSVIFSKSVLPGGNVTPHEICNEAMNKAFSLLLIDIKKKISYESDTVREW